MITDTRTLQMALVGYEQRLEQINQRIAELRARLDGGARKITPLRARTGRRRHVISAAGRKRIAAAQKKRWAAQKRRFSAKGY